MANIERLQHLVVVMERVKQLRLPFDWSTFYDDHLWDESLRTSLTDFSDILNPKVVGPPENFCNTSACVLGWAATDPKFNELGLVVERNPEEPDDRELWAPTFGGFTHANAGRKFFDLTFEEAAFLFFGDGDIDEAIHRTKRVASGEPLNEEEVLQARQSHAIVVMIQDDHELSRDEKSALFVQYLDV